MRRTISMAGTKEILCQNLSENENLLKGRLRGAPHGALVGPVGQGPVGRGPLSVRIQENPTATPQWQSSAWVSPAPGARCEWWVFCTTSVVTPPSPAP